MIRVVNADELKTAFPCGETVRTESVRATIDYMATMVDAVEVVRCKDCRWLENDGYHTRCRITGLSVEAEDYCNRGRKEKR